MHDFRTDEWINGERLLGDDVALIRKNVSISNIRKEDYPFELIVSMLYEELQEEGLPGTEEELELLAENEEVIADYFCKHHGAIFAMCVTSDGARDLFLFVKKKLSNSEIEHSLAASSPTIDYQFNLRSSPDWGVYSSAIPDSDDDGPQSNSKKPWWKKFLG